MTIVKRGLPLFQTQRTLGPTVVVLTAQHPPK
ncbi:hypothetical protein GGC63_006334 [Paenibacillus sp. OAS669]|nr:hypothetical protein [Paenibacillus sp. OAS669]